MSTITPAVAAQNAIVSAVQAALDAAIGSSVVGVINGWPDDMANMPSGTFVVVSAGDLTQEAHVPVPTTKTTAAGIVTQLYDVATWLMNVQVDVFADYDDQRDALTPIVRPVFTNTPWSGHALLTLSGYHSTKIRVKVTGESDDDPRGPIPGRWRHTFEIEAKGEIITSRTWNELQTLALDINGNVTTLE